MTTLGDYLTVSGILFAIDVLPSYNAQVLVFFIITVAAAEVAVGLAIIVALYRARRTTHVEDINSLKF